MFYVASRGHHADIGGITPGSMPPHSTSLQQEGAVFLSFKLVQGGVFQEDGERQAGTQWMGGQDTQVRPPGSGSGGSHLRRVWLPLVRAFAGFSLSHPGVCALGQSWQGDVCTWGWGRPGPASEGSRARAEA